MRPALVVGTLCALLGLQLHAAEAADCACATTNVNIRSGAGTSYSTLGLLTTGNCVTFKGGRATANGYTWVNVDYNGRNAWIASNYVTIRPCSSGSTVPPGGTVPPGCPRIISRSAWGARAPRSTPSTMGATPKYVFIHHGTGPSCSSQSTCAPIVRAYQNEHMDNKVPKWNDIGYSFIVGEDGNVYEGRGWTAQGAHTEGYNSVGIGICVIGDFTSRAPNSAAQTAVRQLIQCGVSSGKISATYRLLGHRDVGSTQCPGTSFYNVIKAWPRYG